MYSAGFTIYLHIHVRVGLFRRRYCIANASRLISLHFQKKEKEPNTKIILFPYRVMKIGLITQSYKE